MRQDGRRDWREICVEVLQEKNTERVSALLEELLEALEERAAAHHPEVPNRREH